MFRIWGQKWTQNVGSLVIWIRGIQGWAFLVFWFGTRFPGLTGLKGPGWAFSADPQRDPFLTPFFSPFVLPWAILPGFGRFFKKWSKMGAKNDHFWVHFWVQNARFWHQFLTHFHGKTRGKGLKLVLETGSKKRGRFSGLKMTQERVFLTFYVHLGQKRVPKSAKNRHFLTPFSGSQNPVSGRNSVILTPFLVRNGSKSGQKWPLFVSFLDHFWHFCQIMAWNPLLFDTFARNVRKWPKTVIFFDHFWHFWPKSA